MPSTSSVPEEVTCLHPNTFDGVANWTSGSLIFSLVLLKRSAIIEGSRSLIFSLVLLKRSAVIEGSGSLIFLLVFWCSSRESLLKRSSVIEGSGSLIFSLVLLKRSAVIESSGSLIFLMAFWCSPKKSLLTRSSVTERKPNARRESWKQSMKIDIVDIVDMGDWIHQTCARVAYCYASSSKAAPYIRWGEQETSVKLKHPRFFFILDVTLTFWPKKTWRLIPSLAKGASW